MSFIIEVLGLELWEYEEPSKLFIHALQYSLSNNQPKKLLALSWTGYQLKHEKTICLGLGSLHQFSLSCGFNIKTYRLITVHLLL